MRDLIHNIAYDECEIQIISGILNYGVNDDDCRKALEILAPTDFVVFGDLFALLQKQFKTSGEIDIVGALQECSLENIFTPLLETYGVIDFVTLKNSCITTANMPTHIAMLKERTKRERISSKMQKILFETSTADMVTEICKLAEEESNALEVENQDIRVYHEKQYKDFITDIYSPYERKERVWTGFSNVDTCLCGLRKGSISMLGARPSTGKTTFALNIVSRQIKDKNKTVVFSLEMSSNQIYERLMSNILDIPYGLFNNKTLSAEHKGKIAKYLSDTLEEDLLLIRDDVYTIEDITRFIANVRPDFVVIDFVNLIRTSKKTNSRREEIDYISSQIKQTARRYNCHIMTLSQLARASKDAKDKAPAMSDLKESGALEQDNDYIILLHRPYVHDKSKHTPEETTLIIDKNKYGKTGIQQMRFDGVHQRFVQITQNY